MFKKSTLLLVAALGVAVYPSITNAAFDASKFTTLKKVNGYSITNCKESQAKNGINFCGKRAVNAYQRLATKENINFNKKYVLIGFKSNDNGYLFTEYAAVNPENKVVYPLAFKAVAYADNVYPRVGISSKKDTICATGSVTFSGDMFLKDYGGNNDANAPQNCFSMTEENGFDFVPSR